MIIGGGPAGLSAALILGRARRKTIVIDAGEPRNQAAHSINGFLGHESIPPERLRELGRQQINRYGVTFVRGCVTSAEHARQTQFPTAFRVCTGDGCQIVGRKLLFATGMRDELPAFPGIRECYGLTIHHCPYCDGYEHRDQHILVYGNDRAKAVGLALNLRNWTERVTVLANGPSLASQDVSRLQRAGINHVAAPIVRFLHEGQNLRAVELQGGKTVEAEALFFAGPQRSSCELPGQLGVECEEPFSGRTNRKQKTNIPGVFLAGDADGDVEFAIVAAAEGATAAVAMNRELQEEDRGEASGNSSR
jgi:thioredoxin reductase